MKPLRLTGQWPLTLAAGAFLAALAILKHSLFQTSAWDLGIFEQYCWLISHSYPSIGTLNRSGATALGDHKAFILYPLALLYRPASQAWMLLVVQAVALAWAGVVVRALSAQLGHDAGMQRLSMGIWFMFPTTVTLALCNFHPDVLAIPALLGMVYYAGGRKWVSFMVCTVVVLSCKDTLAFTVLGVGAWLFLTKRRAQGLATGAFAFGWFLAVQRIWPGSAVYRDALDRYAYLGDSVSHVVSRVAHEPSVLFRQASVDGWIFYPAALLLPVAPWLRRKSFLPMVAALPHFILNLLSATREQRDLSYQYTAGIAPFVVLGALYGMPKTFDGIRHRSARLIIVVVAFLWLSRLQLFFGRYLERATIRAPALQALGEIQPADRVLTTSYLAAHVAGRRIIDLPQKFAPDRLEGFDVLLVSEADPGDATPPGASTLYVLEAKRLHWACREFGAGVFIACRRPG